MNIPKVEREEFLEDCRNSGGFCDCEIFLNSEDYLREKSLFRQSTYLLFKN